MTDNTPAISSQDQVVLDHLKDNFGKLISDEKLLELFERGIEKVLFHREPVRDSYGRVLRHENSMMEEFLHPIIKEKLPKILDERFEKDTGKKIEEVLEGKIPSQDEIIEAALRKVTSNLFAALDATISCAVSNSINQAQIDLNNQRNGSGW